MLSDFPHERLDVYRLYLETTRECESILSQAKPMIVALDHLDRAMESIGVNLMRANAQAPGSQRRSSYLDVSVASTHECAAALDVCVARSVVEADTHDVVLTKLWRIRGMLLGMKRVGTDRVREERVPYGTPRFPFVNLDMYQVSLEGVRWTHRLLEQLDSRARTRRKLDISTTGTVLNIAEGHGRATATDQNRFMKTAEEHAFQTLLLLDLIAARSEAAPPRLAEGKVLQARVISMLYAWCAKSGERE